MAGLLGSLPPGLPADAYAELAVRARHHDVLTVIDAGGHALTAAAKAGAVVRSNAAELRDALGDTTVEDGARQLVELGATAAVITDGSRGMVAASNKGVWRALPVETVSGNPTGAGDACTAVVAAAVAESPEPDWSVVLKSAVAASAAAVLTPVAGDIDLAAYRRWQPQVAVN